MDIDILYDKIRRGMIGRIGMTIPECELLAKTVGKRHLEIGTLWGGSAIFSALAGASRVYSVDHMHGGWWAHGQDPKVNPPLGPAAVIDNLHRFVLAHRVTLVVAPSNPFPLDGLHFDTALIDGDHTQAGVMADWVNVQAVTTGAIMFHDCTDEYPGVMAFLKNKQPEKDGWELSAQVESLRVYVTKRATRKKEEEDDDKPLTTPARQDKEEPIPDRRDQDYPPKAVVPAAKPTVTVRPKRP